MNRKFALGGVSPKLIVVLVVLAVIGAVYWGVRLTRDPADQIPAEYRAFLEKQTYVLWCPECRKESTYQGLEARELLTQGEGEARVIQCPQCQKFVAQWGGRPSDPSDGDAPIMQP